MVRRLAHHVVDGYRTDPVLTELVDTTELWLVPVANPDGYDFTFTPGNRLWRKNLHDDNDGDGRITANDGVDLQPQLPHQVGLRRRGLVAQRKAVTDTGGPLPASEPETRAVDRLMARVGFEFLVNYHAALRGRAVRHHLAGGHPDARRRPLRDARGRRRGARLRPGFAGRPLHRQWRHRRARPPGLRHARVHRGDEHLPDGRRGRPRRRVGILPGAQHPRVPRRRGAHRGRVPQERAVRCSSPVRPPTRPTR